MEKTIGNRDKMRKTELLSFFKKEISEEKLVMLDFGYVTASIERWWSKRGDLDNLPALKAELMNIFFGHLKSNDLYFFDNVGLKDTKVAVVCIKNIFKIDSHKLSLVVHETLSDLFCLNDIKYDYEEHKALYLKPSGENYRDWGNGYGEITPHSDDLYESLNIDYLSLTVCRDITKTPTICFFLRDILRDFNDDELFGLFNLKARFKSGKNVNILKTRDRNVLEYSEKYGFRFFLDFRIDNLTGERMQAIEEKNQYLLDKMRLSIQSSSSERSIPETGTFLIVANHKVLHARAQMNMDKDLARKCGYNSDFSDTPRLLFRSKGPRRELNFYS